MDTFLRRLSPATEFAVVMAVAFGPFAVHFCLAALSPGKPAPLDTASLHFLQSYQPALLLLAGAFLLARGRRLAWLGAPPRWHDAPLALGLLAGAYAVVLPLALLASRLVDLGGETVVLGVAATTLIGGACEELLLSGYVITVLQGRYGFWTAVNVSTAIRVLCHLYQGPAGVVVALPVGLGFAIWAASTRRLWPLVIAHLLFDLLRLSLPA